MEDQAGDEEGESVDYANSQATMREPFPHKPTDLLMNKVLVVIVGRGRGNQSTSGRGRIAVNGRGRNTATRGRGTTVVARGRGNTPGRRGRGNTAPREGRENTAPRGRGGRTPTLPSVMIRERGPNTTDNGGDK